ncbi:MFS transporter [Daejeonella sp. JGW-45]|uniref:MFS transporter n=1 Tax=Daejeonella sp. JGW-45 TaxID=3034148 RepID=UPI0023EB7823|nr:MFS transporter [Daejeonella sp. JGW-45]
MYKARLVFFAACLGLLLFGIGLITLGSVATGLREKFMLDEITAGTLFSIMPFGILTGSLVFGPLCDKYGYKAFLIISSLCMFAGFQGIAYAGDLSLLKIFIFLFGLAGGAINGATNAVVADISMENKGANLSLLGVSFAVGALGMPFILGILEGRYSFSAILSSVGFLTLLAAAFFALINFPPAKQKQDIPVLQGMKLLGDNFILLVGFFLFCQSAYEAVINNWTTSYLIDQLSVSRSNALYALSLYVVGMAVTRLLAGSVFRKAKPHSIMYVSLGLLFLGATLLRLNHSFELAVCGLIITGAGLASGFPVMLGFVGERYAALSATAFSVVLVIALIGNILVTYLMGLIAQGYGISNLTLVTYLLNAVMFILTLLIIRKININPLNNK